MSSTLATQSSPPTVEKPAGRSWVSAVLLRPEVGASAAAIANFVFFFAVDPAFRSLNALSTILYKSSTIGIVAVGVALLMIGGEFDLSSGVSVVTGALAASMIAFRLSLNVWVGVALSLVILLLIGFVNGYVVMRTGIPSFLVTLSTFFILQGVNLGVTRLVTGTVATQNISDMDGFVSAKAASADDQNIGR